MFEAVAFWGFLGGLLRALAGFFSHGKPGWKDLILALVITGFVGIVSASAAFLLDMTLLYSISWKVAFSAGLIGYAGVDLLNSLFIILHKRNIRI